MGKEEAEDGMARKKRKEASPCRGGEEMMDIARDHSLRKNEEHLNGTTRENIRLIHTNTREKQVYVIGDLILRRIDRPVISPDPENRRACYLPGAIPQDGDVRLKTIPVGLEKKIH